MVAVQPIQVDSLIDRSKERSGCLCAGIVVCREEKGCGAEDADGFAGRLVEGAGAVRMCPAGRQSMDYQTWGSRSRL